MFVSRLILAVAALVGDASHSYMMFMEVINDVIY